MKKKLLFILLLLITTVSFTQEKQITKLVAVPNPFTNYTNISFSSTTNSKLTFSVKNILGKTVFKKTFIPKKGKNTFPFYKNSLPKGVYIYSIQNNEKLISKRLVIK